jgi:hypothetical protein
LAGEAAPGYGRLPPERGQSANASLPDNVRQIAILVVGARFDAPYEIYAQIAIAEKEAMKPRFQSKAE